MSEEQIKDINILLDTQKIKALSIDNINHVPHPYMIGPKHLEYNDSMFLGDSQIRHMESEHGPMCYQEKTTCQILYEDHTSIKVVFMELQCNLENKEAGEELFKAKNYLEENDIEGITFVDTPERFRVKEVPPE